MKLKKMLSLLLIPLVLCSNSYAAYINHHYGEKTEEKFVSEYMNSSTVVACFVEYKDFFMMNILLYTIHSRIVKRTKELLRN